MPNYSIANENTILTSVTVNINNIKISRFICKHFNDAHLYRHGIVSDTVLTSKHSGDIFYHAISNRLSAFLKNIGKFNLCEKQVQFFELNVFEIPAAVLAKEDINSIKRISAIHKITGPEYVYTCNSRYILKNLTNFIKYLNGISALNKTAFTAAKIWKDTTYTDNLSYETICVHLYNNGTLPTHIMKNVYVNRLIKIVSSNEFKHFYKLGHPETIISEVKNE